MGLFGKLFEKKVCDLCGEEIGLLGNRKLEDGNCCKKCAAKLSPWFSERRESTVAEIKEQLEYREANKAAVAAFNTTRTLGWGTKVLLDENAGVFMVTSARDLEEANPDVIKLSQVTGCEVDIQESRDEVKREVKDAEGNTRHESYSPRRYNFGYRFYIVIHLNHPYFDQIRFQVSQREVEIKQTSSGSFGMRGASAGGMSTGSYERSEGSTSAPSLALRRNDPDYAKYEETSLEIKEALTAPRQQPQPEAPDVQAAAGPSSEAVPESPAPKAAVICPWCGSSTTPDASGCCEYCGGSLNQ